MLAGIVLFRAAFVNGARLRSTTRSAAIVACHRAEIGLRAADAMNLLQFFSSEGNQSEPFTDQLKTGKSEVLALEALNVLELALEKDQHNPGTLARKIILEAELNKSTADDLKQLNTACSTNPDKHISASLQSLVPVFQFLYGNSQNNNVKHPDESKCALPLNAQAVIEKTFTTGWFRERALLKLFEIRQQAALHRDLLESIKDKTWNFLFKVFVLGISIIVLAFMGLIVVIWQVFFSRGTNSTTT